MSDKGRGFQHIGWKISGVPDWWSSYTNLFSVATSGLAPTSPGKIIHFVKIITIIINHTILRLILKVKKLHENQLLPHLNHFSIFACDLIENTVFGNLANCKKREKKILHPQRLMIKSLWNELISKIHYFFSFLLTYYYIHTEWYHNFGGRFPF